MSPEAWITLGVGTVAALGGIFGQYGAFKYFSGVVNTRLKDHDEKFSALDTEQDQQWSKINKTSEQVAALNALVTDKPNGRAHFAGGD